MRGISEAADEEQASRVAGSRGSLGQACPRGEEDGLLRPRLVSQHRRREAAGGERDHAGDAHQGTRGREEEGA